MLTRRQCPPTQCSVNIDSQILETIKANSVLKGKSTSFIYAFDTEESDDAEE